MLHKRWFWWCVLGCLGIVFAAMVLRQYAFNRADDVDRKAAQRTMNYQP